MKDYQEQFARLLALSKLQEAQIKSNPIPFLNEMAEKNAALMSAIDEAIYHLSGASSFDLAKDAAPHLEPSIVETVTLRNQKAHDALVAGLRAAKEGK